jgi:methionyl-tRNA synthetase
VTGFQVLNQRLKVSNDDYMRTTSERHKATCRKLWQICSDAGDIYLGQYSGWYNIREETFVTESDAQLTDYKDPVSGVPLKETNEASYFFKMSAYQDRLIEYIVENPTFIQPDARREELLTRLKEPLRDLSISRTTFEWGIRVPDGFDQSHVMYVWFDALSNYLTGCDALNVAAEAGDDSDKAAHRSAYWKNAKTVHIIGKDIIWFHCVIWPTILMSAKLPLPATVFAHGFVNDRDGKKMSKSLGNVIDPHDMMDKYSVDTFRFYLAKEAPFGGELAFNEESLAMMHNSDLCDTLGNLVHRGTNLCQKYCGGIIPDVPVDASKLPFNLTILLEETQFFLSKFKIEAIANKTMNALRDVNRYLTESEPWKIKGDDAAAVTARNTIVRTTLEALYVLAHFLAPFIPDGASSIFTKLNTSPRCISTDLKATLMNLSVGTKVDVGEVLYTKIIDENEKDANAKAAALAAAQKKKKDTVAAMQKKQKESAAANGATGAEGGNNFTQMDIRVGVINKVWVHETADKLYCEEIDCGDESAEGGGGGVREIASGLRAHYTLEQMTGMKVLVVCNLKVSKIVGFASNGMVLAAKSGDKVELMEAPAGAAIGERVFLKGFESGFPPATSTSIKKKKTWDAVMKDLKTDGSCVGTWEGKELLTSAGPCFAKSVASGNIG